MIRLLQLLFAPRPRNPLRPVLWRTRQTSGSMADSGLAGCQSRETLPDALREFVVTAGPSQVSYLSGIGINVDHVVE